MPLAARRALARRGLLSLVALLVVAVAATSGAAVGVLGATTTSSARAALGGTDPASLVVTTRLADDPAAQDAALVATVEDLFDGAPVQVRRSEAAADGDTPFVTWTLLADTAVLVPDDLAGLAAGSAALRDVLRRDDAVAVRGITVTGDLGERSAVELAALGAARAVVTVPLVLLLLVSVVALAQVGRVLTGARAAEVDLLVARGASPRRLVGEAAGEATVVAGLAAVCGTVLAAVLLAGRGPWTPGPLVATGAVSALAAVVVLTAVTAGQVRAVVARAGQDRSGRRRRAAAAGTVLAVGAVAVLGLARLRSLGSPAVPRGAGVTADPLAAVAPAVALVALGLVVLAVLGPATRAWAALAARGPRLTGVLVARRTARGLRLAVVPVVLLVLATGSAVLAGTYAGTEHQARTAEAVQAVGTDVRVAASTAGGGTLGPGSGPPDTAAFAALPGAAAAAPALVGVATVQGEEVGATALPAAQVPAVVRTPGAEDLADPLTGHDPFDGAPALPEGTTALVLDVVGSAVPAAGAADTPDSGDAADDGADVAVPTVALTLWVVADDGTLAVLDAGEIALAASSRATTRGTTLEVPVDPLPAGTRLAAVGVDLGAPDLGPADRPLRVDVEVTGVVARTASGDVAVDLGTSWSAVGSVPADDPAGSPRLTTTLTASAPGWARLVAGGGEMSAAVPGLVTDAAAARWDAAPGDTVEVTWAGSAVPLDVVGTVASVPGQERAAGVLVDLGYLDAVLLRTAHRLPLPTEVWVAADTPADVAALAEAVAAEARAQAPGAAVTVTTVPDAVRADAGSPVRLVLLVVAAGATLIALLGLAAVAVTTTAGRRAEVVVLRALGVPPRTQGAGRALELGVVAATGVAAGLLAGGVVSLLAVPGLVAGVVPGATAPVAVETSGVVGAVVAAVLGSAVVVGVVAVVVARQARDTDYRPEVR